MKALKNNPFFANIGQVYEDSKGDYFTKCGNDKYVAVYEFQIFDDFGNASYKLSFGERAQK